MATLKSLAILKPKSNDENIRKIYGQIRTIVSVLAGVGIALNFISATPEEVEGSLSLLDTIIENALGIVSVIGAFISSISSWFDKSAE